MLVIKGSFVLLYNALPKLSLNEAKQNFVHKHSKFAFVNTVRRKNLKIYFTLKGILKAFN